MAIIKMFNPKTKQTNAAMKKAVGYSLKMESVNGLASGINCNFDTAYEEFKLIKNMFHKENGRLYIHFEQSFPPNTTASPEKLHEIGRRLIEKCPTFDGFQVVIGTHTDRDHVHNHFIINSVNADNGKKWHLSNKDLARIKETSLEICKEENIPIWWDPRLKNERDAGVNHTVSQGEYEKQKVGESWKYQLFQTIQTCIKQSDSKESFIAAMQDRGYLVNWTDRLKYITFTTPDGMKCRNNKLYPVERFTKENLLKQIEKNAETTKEKSEGAKQKSECYKAIMLCSKHTHSKDEFIHNMEALGYGVQWDQHKHLVFITPGGRHFREDKFYPADRITKENLLAQFEKNCDCRSKRTKVEHQKEMNQIISNVKTLLSAIKNHEHSNHDYPLTQMERKKNLEGDALKEKAIEKSNSSYDWENEF